MIRVRLNLGRAPLTPKSTDSLSLFVRWTAQIAAAFAGRSSCPVHRVATRATQLESRGRHEEGRLPPGGEEAADLGPTLPPPSTSTFRRAVQRTHPLGLGGRGEEHLTHDQITVRVDDHRSAKNRPDCAELLH